ncbi:hypothetical protein [Nitrosophilus labii]|uniref:hypothetical protein n=1 Tax=Nitrosophilus labii TaxID=2706014 RepID=UPI001657607A|nr:hypothetical protein [Nitrosophilus labii]
MSTDTVSRVAILIFIIVFVLVGTYLEFRKPKKKISHQEIDKDQLNKIILDSLKEEENENSHI